MIQWVKELYPEEGERRCKSFKTPVRCSQEEKIQAVMESCKGNLKITQIADIYGVTPSAVSVWRRELLGEGRTLKMPNSSTEDKTTEQLLREKAELEAKVKRLEHDVYKLQLERDVLEKAGDILKKEKGISLDKLTNREKVFLIDALRSKYQIILWFIQIEVAITDGLTGFELWIPQSLLVLCPKKDVLQTILLVKDSLAG